MEPSKAVVAPPPNETQPDWREWRRRRAWALKQQGWKQKDIAVALGVTPGAVSQWCACARAGGVEALRRRLAPGRPPKLAPAQVRRLPELLDAGAEAYGFRGQVWTTKRVAHLIGLRLGALYHPAHVSRLLRTVGWSVQQPMGARHPTQQGRDQGMVGGARARAQKKAAAEQRMILWVDQSGFYLLPMAVRTYAPRGQTPVLRVKVSHDQRASISGLSSDARLFMQVQDHAYRSKDVVRFLRLLLRKIAGKLLVSL